MATPRISRAAGSLAAIALVTLVTACGAASQVAAPRADGDQRLPHDASGGAAGAPAEEGSDEQAPDAALALDFERRIVRIGEISIEVGDVDATATAVRALALELGGYVGASQSGAEASGATLTLRVPADRFEDALAALHQLNGEVVSETTRDEDVTGSLVDLEARIENLRASETTYRTLLERATEMEDILAVQSRLDEVRGQIEQLTAQAESLAGQADLSTLTVRLVPRSAPVETSSQAWDPGRQVEQAVAALLTVGQALLTALIWIAVVLVPLGIVIGVGAAVVIRVVQPLRRRVTETQA